MSFITPENYKPNMNVRETERAIKFVKDAFQRNFVQNFGFDRISAPIIVRSHTGVNDDLSGVERAVRFEVKEQDNAEAEIVHSLAKWKRIALEKYHFQKGEGLYTDMNAIRRDDKCDNVHSIYVDQWDWEMVICNEQRTKEFLKRVVLRIVGAICDTLEETKKAFPAVKVELKRDVKFITTEELLALYPDKTAHERERLIAKKYGTVFLMEIGAPLSNGEPHDNRAPDYDDWSLNGDILFYDSVLDDSIEISSMGVRVDGETLAHQLKMAGTEDRMKYDYHKQVADGTLPLTIGGGIGQSRLCMLLLGKAHIGEVQASLWPEAMIAECEKKGIHLL